ncbi:TPA: hypothetical protein DCX15_01290 [bacterium]|nr:hypothetical protein [bacterium]
MFVECKADKVLVRALGIPEEEIEHAGGKTGVCKRLGNSRNSKGLVDEDPLCVQPSYIEALKSLSVKNNVKLLYDEESQNRLIILCPRLEGWILKMAREGGVEVKDYGLPAENEDKLHRVVNTNLEGFKGLIEEMRDKGLLKSLEEFIE